MLAIFERDPDTDAVVKALRGVNQDISYTDLAKVAGMKLVRTKQVLASARRILLREKILFGTLRGHGVLRMTDADKARNMTHGIKLVGRAASREIKKADTIQEFEKLPNIVQITVTTNRTILNLIKQQALASSMPKPVEPVKQASPPETENLIQLAR